MRPEGLARTMHSYRLETVETLAARFALPQRTVVREVLRCRLPYVSIAGNWRFRERDIEIWLRRVGPLPRLSLHTGGGAQARQTAKAERTLSVGG